MNSEDVIDEGKHVLIYLTRTKKWMTKISSGGRLHTHAGYIGLDQLIGKEYGATLYSNTGRRFWALKPTIQEFVMKGERKTQIVYPKDAGLIASKTGVASGSVVVEAGTGSGILTMFLANLVRPDGHIYSLDLREEFLAVAKRNLERSGLLKYVTLKQGDARQGFGVKGADIAVLDVGDPWAIVKPAYEALKGSGALVSISPTVNQVERTVAELEGSGFVDVECIEVLVRDIEARPGMTRPSMRMIGHTAYLTFARKVLETEPDQTDQSLNNQSEGERNAKTYVERLQRAERGVAAYRSV